VNNRVALSNKIFTYLLAGIPVLASDTTAQSELAEETAGAVFVYPQGDAQTLADQMDELMISQRRLTSARQAAWQYGQQKFNWDTEQRLFLKMIASVLSPS
jgi:glycosyltransferase involved in cell wall biosynthesis